jgi:hypothetical protein
MVISYADTKSVVSTVISTKTGVAVESVVITLVKWNLHGILKA